MTYEQIRDLILSFGSRYLASWVLKALCSMSALTAYSSEQKQQYATMSVSLIIALATALADFIHSKACHQQALQTEPPK